MKKFKYVLLWHPDCPEGIICTIKQYELWAQYWTDHELAAHEAMWISEFSPLFFKFEHLNIFGKVA